MGQPQSSAASNQCPDSSADMLSRLARARKARLTGTPAAERLDRAARRRDLDNKHGDEVLFLLRACGLDLSCIGGSPVKTAPTYLETTSGLRDYNARVQDRRDVDNDQLVVLFRPGRRKDPEIKDDTDDRGSLLAVLYRAVAPETRKSKNGSGSKPGSRSNSPAPISRLRRSKPNTPKTPRGGPPQRPPSASIGGSDVLGGDGGLLSLKVPETIKAVVMDSSRSFVGVVTNYHYGLMMRSVSTRNMSPSGVSMRTIPGSVSPISMTEGGAITFFDLENVRRLVKLNMADDAVPSLGEFGAGDLAWPRRMSDVADLCLSPYARFEFERKLHSAVICTKLSRLSGGFIASCGDVGYFVQNTEDVPADSFELIGPVRSSRRVVLIEGAKLGSLGSSASQSQETGPKAAAAASSSSLKMSSTVMSSMMVCGATPVSPVEVVVEEEEGEEGEGEEVEVQQPRRSRSASSSVVCCPLVFFVQTGGPSLIGVWTGEEDKAASTLKSFEGGNIVGVGCASVGSLKHVAFFATTSGIFYADILKGLSFDELKSSKIVLPGVKCIKAFHQHGDQLIVRSWIDVRLFRLRLREDRSIVAQQVCVLKRVSARVSITPCEVLVHRGAEGEGAEGVSEEGDKQVVYAIAGRAMEVLRRTRPTGRREVATRIVLQCELPKCRSVQESLALPLNVSRSESEQETSLLRLALQMARRELQDSQVRGVKVSKRWGGRIIQQLGRRMNPVDVHEHMELLRLRVAARRLYRNCYLSPESTSRLAISGDELVQFKMEEPGVPHEDVPSWSRIRGVSRRRFDVPVKDTPRLIILPDPKDKRNRPLRAALSHHQVGYVGVGAYSEVYLASYLATDAAKPLLVAVKVPRLKNPEKLDIDNLHTMGYFQIKREAAIMRAIGQAESPKVEGFVKCVDYFESSAPLDCPYTLACDRGVLVMEYLDRGSLKEWIVKNIEVKNHLQRTEICLNLSIAVQNLHDAGGAHRDLKPEQVMLLPIQKEEKGKAGRQRGVDPKPGQVMLASPLDHMKYVTKVLDLGMASFGDMTLEGDFMKEFQKEPSIDQVPGTPPYTPKQAEVAGTAQQADIYALGGTMCDVFSMEKPDLGFRASLDHFDGPKRVKALIVSCRGTIPERPTAEKVVEELRKAVAELTERRGR